MYAQSWVQSNLKWRVLDCTFLYPFAANAGGAGSNIGSKNRGRPRGCCGRGSSHPRGRAVYTPVITQYQIGYSFRGYDFDAVEFSPRPTLASLMDAEQPEHFGF